MSDAERLAFINAVIIDEAKFQWRMEGDGGMHWITAGRYTLREILRFCASNCLQPVCPWVVND